jgi:hypothetical protein
MFGLSFFFVVLGAIILSFKYGVLTALAMYCFTVAIVLIIDKNK